MITLETTGYSNHDNCPSCTDTLNGRTATGLIARYGTCAVDPAYITLGTILFVPSYGPCWATDTGRVIKGPLVDVYLDSQGEAEDWGRRITEIQVLGFVKPH
jgi:3D (Asp-Asp-Asp) domain-containing protein